MAVEFNEAYVLEAFDKYFGVDEKVVLDALDKRVFDSDKHIVDLVDKNRLQAILQAITPYCEKFVNVTSAQRKWDVAKKLLCIKEREEEHTLNYDAFYSGESCASTASRLESVFEYTSQKGINIYNIIGQTMLIEANLMVKRDPDNKKRIIDAYEWAPRMIWNIYEAVAGIGFSDEAIVKIFEKAKTIFSKGFADGIKLLYDAVQMDKFSVRKNQQKYVVIDEELFKSAVKKCSTILVDPYEKIKRNFDYIIFKTDDKLSELKDNYDFEGKFVPDGEIISGFVKSTIQSQPSFLTEQVRKLSENNYVSEKIDNYIEKNFKSFVENLGIELVDERDRMSDEEEFQKYGDGERKLWEKENGIVREENEEENFSDKTKNV